MARDPAPALPDVPGESLFQVDIRVGRVVKRTQDLEGRFVALRAPDSDCRPGDRIG